jgi:hypothetical protein
MRLTFFGYEFIFRPIPKGPRFVTDEEYAEREKRVDRELAKIRDGI